MQNLLTTFFLVTNFVGFTNFLSARTDPTPTPKTIGTRKWNMAKVDTEAF